MTQSPDDPLSDRHLVLFATILQCFARYEALIDGLMATLSGASPSSLRVLTATLGFAQKRETLLSLMRQRGVPAGHYDRVRRFLDAAYTHRRLAQDIAHSTWAATASQARIFPSWLSHGQADAVKPVHQLENENESLPAWPEDAASYTLDDLQEIATILKRNRAEFQEYVASRALLVAINRSSST